ncbi:hypothetical protein GCM10029992_25510 [Glycomyces albus]
MRLWQIRETKTSQGASWQVRWRVGTRTRPFSRTFTTKELAAGFQEDLHAATRRGEAFDTDTGLPPSLDRDREPDQTTWYDHARDYTEYKWPRLAATSRASTAEALTAITCALLPKRSARPPETRLRADLKQWAFTPARPGPDRPVPENAITTLVWAAAHSPPSPTSTTPPASATCSTPSAAAATAPPPPTPPSPATAPSCTTPSNTPSPSTTSRPTRSPDPT